MIFVGFRPVEGTTRVCVCVRGCIVRYPASGMLRHVSLRHVTLWTGDYHHASPRPTASARNGDCDTEQSLQQRIRQDERPSSEWVNVLTFSALTLHFMKKFCDVLVLISQIAETWSFQIFQTEIVTFLISNLHNILTLTVLLGRYKCFGETYCLHLRNVVIYPHGLKTQKTWNPYRRENWRFLFKLRVLTYVTQNTFTLYQVTR